MANQAVQNQIAVLNQDITVPTAASQYPLGLEVSIHVGSGDTRLYKYIQAHAALTQYQPYILNQTGVTLKSGAPATGAGKVVIPQVAFTNAFFGFVLMEGEGKVLMISETYAVGDKLEILNTGTALVVDGTSGATVDGVKSQAVCMESGTTAVSRNVYVMGFKADIAAT